MKEKQIDYSEDPSNIEMNRSVKRALYFLQTGETYSMSPSGAISEIHEQIKILREMGRFLIRNCDEEKGLKVFIYLQCIEILVGTLKQLKASPKFRLEQVNRARAAGNPPMDPIDNEYAIK
jgi:hypothetical protein